MFLLTGNARCTLVKLAAVTLRLSNSSLLRQLIHSNLNMSRSQSLHTMDRHSQSTPGSQRLKVSNRSASRSPPENEPTSLSLHERHEHQKISSHVATNERKGVRTRRQETILIRYSFIKQGKLFLKTQSKDRDRA